MKQANAGIEQLAAHVDTLIIVPNQNLFHVTSDRTTFPPKPLIWLTKSCARCERCH